jgi:hypothetical protein
MSDDPQDMAEALDSDKLGTPDDPDVEPEFPPDELLGADDYGLTAAEERVDEPLEERADRESPDPLERELDRVDEGDRSDVETELNELELELDEDTLAAIDRIEPLVPGDDLVDEETTDVGRLVEPGVDEDVLGVDDEGASVAVAFDEQDLSAEEAAVHLTDDPPI